MKHEPQAYELCIHQPPAVVGGALEQFIALNRGHIGAKITDGCSEIRIKLKPVADGGLGYSSVRMVSIDFID